jgi:hypothetical protein
VISTTASVTIHKRTIAPSRNSYRRVD